MTASKIYMTTTTPITIQPNGTVPLDTIARRTGCLVQNGGNSVLLLKTGYYDATATITFTGAAVGEGTIALAKNGTPIQGMTATETIGTASTETHTLTITGLIRVFKGEDNASLSLLNQSSIALNISNVSLVVEAM